MIRDRDTARRLLAFRVVREAIFNPGERFLIVSHTEESAAALMREIEYQVKSLTNATTAGGGGEKGGSE